MIRIGYYNVLLWHLCYYCFVWLFHSCRSFPGFFKKRPSRSAAFKSPKQLKLWKPFNLTVFFDAPQLNHNTLPGGRSSAPAGRSWQKDSVHRRRNDTFWGKTHVCPCLSHRLKNQNKLTVVLKPFYLTFLDIQVVRRRVSQNKSSVRRVAALQSCRYENHVNLQNPRHIEM